MIGRELIGNVEPAKIDSGAVGRVWVWARPLKERPAPKPCSSDVQTMTKPMFFRHKVQAAKSYKCLPRIKLGLKLQRNCRCGAPWL